MNLDKTKKSKSKKFCLETNEPKKNRGLEADSIIDVTCPICLSIFIEPVSMPCNHALCMSCFQLNVAESSLCCPLCRKRISIWVRKKSKTKDLVDETFWKKIQEAFPEEVAARLNGVDDLENTFTSTIPPRKVSAPGEIKEEYEKQMKKLREEAERKRIEEEQASKPVLTKLLEEEALQKAQKERLAEVDFEYAKQLRSSQMKETLNNLKSSHPKSPWSSSTSTTPRSSSKSPIGPMDVYIDPSPSSSKDSLSPHHSKVKSRLFSPSSRMREYLKGEQGDQSSLSSVNSKSVLSRPSSSRLLKDITAQYSSESESEFDSEENIIKSPRIPKMRTNNKENKKNDEEFGITQKNKDGIEKPLLADVNIPTAELCHVFNENEMNEETLKRLLEEQQLVEERLKQEREDRLFAMQLQKSLKEVDRTKGSDDEYCLRNKKETKKRPRSSDSHVVGNRSSSSASPSGSEPRFRQTTLFENISKKQRRL